MTQNIDWLEQSKALSNYHRALRRDFHIHPELGFNEKRTAGIVAQELKASGLEVLTGVAQTGVVGILEGSQPGPVVMVRFDMDALPVLEDTGAEYASQTPGVMHACGHDGHVAVGLSVAKLLKPIARQLKGTVKFVFQPAEEGMGGAESMIRDGVLKNPRPDICLGLHLWNDLPLGKAGVSAGPVMAQADIFTVKITGKGGHGAMPHSTHDPLVAAAQWVVAIQSVVARNVSPLSSAVVSVTQIHGGDAPNVIPQQVSLAGTIRTFQPEVRQRVIERMETLTQGIASSFECSAELNIHTLTPAVVNDPQISQIVIEQAQGILPAGGIVEYQTMGSEDMAFYLEQIPGCYFFVGSANAERGLAYSHHHPKFDFDEEALTIAAAWMAASVAACLA